MKTKTSNLDKRAKKLAKRAQRVGIHFVIGGEGRKRQQCEIVRGFAQDHRIFFHVALFTTPGIFMFPIEALDLDI